jgi:hypothetical protein
MPGVLRVQRPRKRYIPLVAKHEENLQRQICHYLRVQYPNAIFRSDYASGLHLTMHQAAIHKSLQSSRSFPDLMVLSPRRDFYGLFLELKREGTTIIIKKGPKKGQLVASPHIREQLVMLKALRARGYYATFACGFDQAKSIIDWYFGNIERPNAEIF